MTERLTAKERAAENLRKDPDYYKRMGSKGGKAKFPGKGFAGNPDLAKVAGALGGKRSKPYTKNPKPSKESL